MIKERLEKLRNIMKEEGIDFYLVPTADFHESEYVGEYFEVRKYLSGFTGSAGSLLVTRNKAMLWTDGRYFIQAERELAGTGIELMRMGEPNTKTIGVYIEDNIKQGEVLGFDGRVVNTTLGLKLKKIAEDRGAKISYSKDLVDTFWEDRKSLPKNKAFFLEEKYSGRSVASKLEFLREEIKKQDATATILTTLDDIAWLYNIRGGDIPCNPVVLSYSVVTEDRAYIFLNRSVLNERIEEEFEKNKVEVRDYAEIYNFVKKMTDKRIMFDFSKVNFAIYSNLGANIEKLNVKNPTMLEKAKKNKIEIENIKKGHIKDAVAVTKFIYWLKKNVGKLKITEVSAAKYLEDRRKEQEGYIEPSFETISAYNENAAMMHYSPSEDKEVALDARGLLLVDSGGQYYEGTTDITRTIVLGEVAPNIKVDYTLVLKGHLNLQNAKFLYGCTGHNLDILSREPLWKRGLDYRSGTGHGVGYLLNVHEAPNGFRWKIVPERNDSAVLEEGMITTDEPGIYVENSHGIRIENELLCKKWIENEYGQFMCFEPVTYVPIDKEAIDLDYLEKSDIEELNEYHRMVFKKISSYFVGEELEWLKEACKPI